MKSSERALTLIEVIVCVGLISAVCIAATGINSHLSEEARTAKCQSNLRRQIDAIFMYVADHDGVLPGPTHPTIKRHVHDIGGREEDKTKSLTWLLRPYFPEVGDSSTNPATANPIVDAVFQCPTASMISPDETFVNNYPNACWQERPYNYACNTWGPIKSPGSTFTISDSEWYSTDPPHYFGVWYYCDSSPERIDVCWKPKRLDMIANASGEWATSDAWFRRIPTMGGRGGTVRRRTQGTFAPNVENYKSPLPSAPYHRTRLSDARSHKAQDVFELPVVDFTGETNQAYFDGHVAPQRGQWLNVGDGGTVNPYWEAWGGTHPFTEPWSTDECNK